LTIEAILILLPTSMQIGMTSQVMYRPLTLGYCVFIGGNHIAWKNKQNIVDRFSAQNT